MRFLGIIIGFMLLSNLAFAANDSLLLSARDAYKRGDAASLSSYAQQLQAQNDMLAPYAEYWLLSLQLNDATDETVQRFLGQYADYPFTDKLRGEWLKTLAKHQSWTTFFAERPNYKREDVGVMCSTLLGRLLAGENIGTEAQALWLTPNDQPAECNTLFSEMQSRGVLSDEAIWARLRLALQENKTSLAKNLLQRLPNSALAQLKLLDKAVQNPASFLDKNNGSNKNRLTKELNFYVLERLAVKQPDSALSKWNQVRGNFALEDQAYFWARLALRGARVQESRTLGWFAQAENTPLDKEQLAWKTRAALRVQDWELVQNTITQMSPEQQSETTWRYWLARAYQAQQNTAGANLLYNELARNYNYYGLLAQEELGKPLTALPANAKASRDEIQQVANLPAMQRLQALQKLDLRGEAKAEWVTALQYFDDRQLNAAASYAMQNQWLDLAINTAEKTLYSHDFSLRYPMPHLDVLQEYAAQNNLDPAWVYGLIRQESRFVSDARSAVGAAGLMQVMPATAKWIAKKMQLVGYNNSLIHQLDTNIKLGTFYLAHVLEQMNGNAAMATAGYNAGPGRPKRWAAAEPLETAIYIENIPLTETRDYVRKVMANAHFYSLQLGLKTLPLKQRLGEVAAKTENTLDATAE